MDVEGTGGCGLVGRRVGSPDPSMASKPKRRPQGPAIAPMRALILDGDGATLVMGRRHWGLIRESGLDHLVEVAPHGWRAFEVRRGSCVVMLSLCLVCAYPCVCVAVPSNHPTNQHHVNPPPSSTWGTWWRRCRAW